jgi:hypothetical protein
MPSASEKPRRGRPPKTVPPEVAKYAGYLRGRKLVRQKTAMDYAKAAADGALTRYVRENFSGLPDGFSTLLELKNKKDLPTLKAISQWWEKEGGAGYPNPAHMSSLLDYCGAAKGATPKKRERPLSAPPYGLGFTELADILERFSSSGAERTEFRAVLLACLTDGDEKRERGDWTNAQSPDFRMLRAAVLDLKNSSIAANRLADSFPHLADACRRAALAVVGNDCRELFEDMRRRSVPYDKSLWPILNAMYGARSDLSAGRAFFRLARAVLRDYDAAQLAPAAHAEPGDALRDAEFWTSPLLRECLSRRPPLISTELLQTLPEPGDETCRRWRDAEYFLLLRYAARLPADKAPDEMWDAAAEWMRKAADFWREHGAELLPMLRDRDSGVWNAVPDSELTGGPETCFIYIRMLREQAEAELRRAARPEASSVRRDVSLDWAGDALDKAFRGLAVRMGNGGGLVGQLTAEQIEGRPVCLTLLTECHLLSARTRTEKALRESRSLRPEDVVSLYAAPARRDIAEARSELELLGMQSEKETERLKKECENTRLACRDAFFSVPSGLPDGERERRESLLHTEAFQREQDEWKKEPANGYPAVVGLPPRVQAVFPPVFCSCFDSARFAADAGGERADANREKAETTLVQTLVSPQTALLQYNQLTDNRIVMELLSIPAIQAVCRKGFLVCSPFGVYDTPTEYLRACLQNEGYVFSSTRLFSMDGSPEQQALGRANRGNMLRFVEQSPEFRSLKRSDWGTGDEWEEACRLAEFYRRLDECFPHTAGANPYRQTRQDSADLSRTVDRQLKLLLSSAADDERRALFAEMERWADRFRSFTSRSQYLLAIRTASGELQKGDALARRALEKLTPLVHDCYNISNGRKSNCIVELSDVDPELQPFQGMDGDVRVPDEDGMVVSMRSRMIMRGESAELAYSNLVEAAMISREIAQAAAHLAPERRAGIAEREMKIRFEPIAGSIHATGLSMTDSRGNILKVSSGKAAAGAAGREMQEWYPR